MTAIAKLRFFFCGKGDTILVKACNGQETRSEWGLVDCCLTKRFGAYYRIRDFITEGKVTKLKFVCLTHPDRDHYFGMRRLLEERFYDKASGRLQVEEFWDSGVQFKLLASIAYQLGLNGVKQEIDDLYRFFFRFSLMDELNHRTLNQGCVAPMEFGDFYFLCLSPTTNRIDRFNQQTLRSILSGSDDYVLRRREESNNLSVVLVFLHKMLPINIVLGGDASASVWKEALAAWDKLARILQRREPRFAAIKVSHHGTAGRNNKYLYPSLYSHYCTARKTIAILTIGRGDPNHPHQAVLDVLQQHGIRTYATCQLVQSLTWIKTELPLPGRTTAQQMAIGYDCGDIEVCVQDDGSLAVDPPQSRIL